MLRSIIEFLVGPLTPREMPISRIESPDRGYRPSRPLLMVTDAGWVDETQVGVGVWIPELKLGMSFKAKAVDSMDAELFAVLLAAKIAKYLGRDPRIVTDCQSAVSYLTEEPSTRRLEKEWSAKKRQVITSKLYRRKNISETFASCGSPVIVWQEREGTKIAHYLGALGMKRGSNLYFFNGTESETEELLTPGPGKKHRVKKTACVDGKRLRKTRVESMDWLGLLCLAKIDMAAQRTVAKIKGVGQFWQQ